MNELLTENTLKKIIIKPLLKVPPSVCFLVLMKELSQIEFPDNFVQTNDLN